MIMAHPCMCHNSVCTACTLWSVVLRVVCKSYDMCVGEDKDVLSQVMVYAVSWIFISIPTICTFLYFLSSSTFGR